jgi:hypothetical protein
MKQSLYLNRISLKVIILMHYVFVDVIKDILNVMEKIFMDGWMDGLL